MTNRRKDSHQSPARPLGVNKQQDNAGNIIAWLGFVLKKNV